MENGSSRGPRNNPHRWRFERPDRCKSVSAQALAGAEGMARKEFSCIQTSSTLELERENAQGLLTAADHNALLGCGQDLARRGRTPVVHFGLPDFEQLRP